MRQRLVILSLALVACLTLSAQMHRVGVGLSAGAHTQFGDSAVTNLWGPTVGLSFRYTCLFHVGSEVWLGPQTGLEAAWTRSGWRQELSDQFSNKDYLGHQIDYTLSGKLDERHDHVTVTIPIMAALRYQGVVVGLGLKARALLWTKHQTTASDVDISAYYPEFDVRLAAEDCVEELSSALEISGARKTPEWHIALAAEAGYEWKIARNQYLGALLFVDYGLWNSYSRPDDAPQRSLDVTLIEKAGMMPQLVLSPIYSTIINRFRPFSVGVTITYTFDFESKTHHCNCLPY